MVSLCPVITLCAGLSCSGVSVFVLLLLCVWGCHVVVSLCPVITLCVGLSCSGVTVLVLSLLCVWGCHVVVSLCLSCHYSVCGAVM